MTKSDTELVENQSLIKNALQKNRFYGSQAEDFGTDTRTAKSLIQRILITSIGQNEYSQELIAAVLLNYPSAIKSHPTTWCFATKAVAHIKQSDFHIAGNLSTDGQTIILISCQSTISSL